MKLNKTICVIRTNAQYLQLLEFYRHSYAAKIFNIKLDQKFAKESIKFA